MLWFSQSTCHKETLETMPLDMKKMLSFLVQSWTMPQMCWLVSGKTMMIPKKQTVDCKGNRACSKDNHNLPQSCIARHQWQRPCWNPPVWLFQLEKEYYDPRKIQDEKVLQSCCTMEAVRNLSMRWTDGTGMPKGLCRNRSQRTLSQMEKSFHLPACVTPWMAQIGWAAGPMREISKGSFGKNEPSKVQRHSVLEQAALYRANKPSSG